jgi:hypothetical protein
MSYKNLGGGDILEELLIDGRIKLRLILKKQNVRVRITLIWIRIVTSGEFM